MTAASPQADAPLLPAEFNSPGPVMAITSGTTCDTLPSGCWSALNDQIEFDNVVVRIPPDAVREQEIRGQVKQWLSEALVPEVVAKLISTRYEDTEERKLAEKALKSFGAGKQVGSRKLLAAIESVALRGDATPQQYEIAALQAEVNTLSATLPPMQEQENKIRETMNLVKTESHAFLSVIGSI